MSRLAGFRAVARREGTRLQGVLAWLAFPIPLVAAACVLCLFAARSPREMPIAVVALDRGAVARQLVRDLDASPALRVAAMPPTFDEAAVLLRGGRVRAVVALPERLERRMARTEAPASAAWIDMQSLTTGNLVQRELRAVFNAAGARLERRNPPDPVGVAVRPLFNPSLDYAAYLGMAMLAALVQVVALVALVHALGAEGRDGTMQAWLAAAGGSRAAAILGKIVPWTLWFALLGTALGVAAHAWLGLPALGVRTWTVFAAIQTLLAAACTGISLLALGAAGNLRMATSMTAFVGGPAFAFSGMTFPLIAMPFPARLWAWILPSTHALAAQTRLVFVGGDLETLRYPLAALTTLALATGAPGMWLLARRLAEPSRWRSR